MPRGAGVSRGAAAVRPVRLPGNYDQIRRIVRFEGAAIEAAQQPVLAEATLVKRGFDLVVTPASEVDLLGGDDLQRRVLARPKSQGGGKKEDEI